MFDVETEEGERFRAPAVIVTAGGTPVKLGVPGEDGVRGQGRLVLRDLRWRVFQGPHDRGRRRRRCGGRGE